MPWIYTNTKRTPAVTNNPNKLGSCPTLNKVSAISPLMAESITKGITPTGPSSAGIGLKTLQSMLCATPAIRYKRGARYKVSVNAYTIQRSLCYYDNNRHYLRG